MQELKKIVARNISALRIKNGMTQLELGELLNYSDKAVSRWERADAVPDASVLLRMSEIFGVTVDYLLHSHEDEEKPEGDWAFVAAEGGEKEKGTSFEAAAGQSKTEDCVNKASSDTVAEALADEDIFSEPLSASQAGFLTVDKNLPESFKNTELVGPAPSEDVIVCEARSEGQAAAKNFTEEEALRKRIKKNRQLITAISFFGVWTAALLLYIMLSGFGIDFKLTFVYAVPVSAVVLLVLNSIWGTRRGNVLFVSMLVWSVIASVYLSLLRYNMWMLFLLGIPAQIIILLSSSIRSTGKRKGG